MTSVVEPPQRGRFSSGQLAFFAVALLFVFNIVVGVRGIPFGSHWDEWYAQKGTKKVVTDLELFPGDFTYNGMYFDLAALPVLPRMAARAAPIFEQIARKPTRPLKLDDYPAITAMQKELAPWVDSEKYVHQARTVFLVLTSLALFALFFTIRKLMPWAPGAAVAAAAFCGLSWEVTYHARYIAVDSIMFALAALLLLAIASARMTTGVAAQCWWAVAGISGGLAAGCKITGAFFCIPIGIAALLSPDGVPQHAPLRSIFKTARAARLRRCAWAALWFVIAMLASTPGLVRDPFRFYAGLAHTAMTYTGGGKFAYAVSSRFDMVWKCGHWLLASVPSPFLVIGLLCSVIALWGLVRLYRYERVVFITCVLLFVAYGGLIFVAAQLIVRNALPLIPVIAIGFAFGVEGLVQKIRASRHRRALTAIALVVCVAWVAVNAGFLVYAAESIRTTTKQSIRADAAAWLNEHADRTLYLSPTMKRRVGGLIAQAYTCGAPLAEEPPLTNDATRVALFISDHDRFRWLANRRWFYEKHFSSLETNLDHYPNWRSRHFRHRIVVLAHENARANHIKLKGYTPCTPGAGAPAADVPDVDDDVPERDPDADPNNRKDVGE